MSAVPVLFAILVSLAFGAFADAAEMRMAVTTSFHNSGLSEILLPEIKKDLDLDVRLVVVGTGQALRLGRAGDVDAVLVHSRRAEENFVAAGFATHRRKIMYNDFVFIGPENDPANISGVKSASAALSAIERSKAVFVSRGDDSGTHRRELSLWESAGLDADGFNDGWYRAAGAGMGATLNIASAMNGYVMSDRASWLKFNNKGELKLLFAGDPALFNQYAFLPVNPAKHAHVNNDHTRTLEDWLVSAKAQKMIGDYVIAGEKLFTPNAKLE